MGALTEAAKKWPKLVDQKALAHLLEQSTSPSPGPTGYKRFAHSWLQTLAPPPQQLPPAPSPSAALLPLRARRHLRAFPTWGN
jgi:hypothetical protein